MRACRAAAGLTARCRWTGPGAGAVVWTTAMPLCRVWRRVLCSQDVITVQVNDGQGGVTAQEVTITIQDRNDGPVAVNDSATTAEDSGRALRRQRRRGFCRMTATSMGIRWLCNRLGRGRRLRWLARLSRAVRAARSRFTLMAAIASIRAAALRILALARSGRAGWSIPSRTVQGGTAQAVLTVRDGHESRTGFGC